MLRPNKPNRVPRRVILGVIALALLTVALGGWLLWQIPAVQDRLAWRLITAQAYVQGLLNPVEAIPTARPTAIITAAPSVTPSPSSTLAFTPTPTVLASPTPTATPTPLPAAAALSAPEWERQDINNCGPASLAMHLRMFGWGGDQFDIAEVIKPLREDRNVNVEELAYYVSTNAGWLRVIYRVGGDLDLLKQFIANGLPVMIEESFYFEDPFWPNDDLWAAHYQLLTGYDDAAGVFTAQDSYYGADQRIEYAQLDENWKIFNRVYILIYTPEQEPLVQSILGAHWDAAYNRQHALEVALAETEADAQDAHAWFNLGSNYVYFEKYPEAATAYDTARSLGLPQRMLRYQFGPFFAYFHAGRTEELLALAEYALERTPNAEEALLWRGWGLYRQGDTTAAVADWRAALEANPNYPDAVYALNFVGATP